MGIDDRIRRKEEIARAEMPRVKPHPAAEPATIRPAPTPYDLPIRDMTEGGTKFPPPPHVPKSLHIPRISIATIKDLAWLLAALSTGLTWFQNRASQKDVADAELRAVATCASAITAAVAPVASALVVVSDAQAKDEKRWNRLDRWAASAKIFHKASETPPPTFGSEAENMGRQ